MVWVRPAGEGDIRAVAEFQTRCWNEAYQGLVDQAYLDRNTADTRELRWRHRLLHGGVRMALAEIGARGPGGELVGVVSWCDGDVTDAPPLELKTLYVASSQYGEGVAPALVETAIGSRPAHLWVFEENPRAQAFYRKQGFRADGRAMLDVDTGVQEIRMVRP